MRLTILMPSLNEEEAIAKTIESVPIEKITRMGYFVEILLIDGGSSDRTKEIAESMGVRVVNSIKGYGRQYRIGFQEAQGDIIVTGDSDNSYPLYDIPRLLNILEEEEIDFLSTNRYANMAAGSMPMVNNIGNLYLTFLTNLLFGLKLNDSQSGMWVFRKEAIQKIVLKSNGMPLSQEIKIEAFTKLRAKEIDSFYHKRLGKVKLRVIKDGWDNTKHLFKKRFGFD